MNISISLDKNSKSPLYQQLYLALRKKIETGYYDNERLPSIRKLARLLDINNVTVISAYKLLEKEGYVYSTTGSGTYIKGIKKSEGLDFMDSNVELMNSGVYKLSKESIDLSTVSPTSKLFPIEEFKQALISILDRDGADAFLYPEINGYAPLRESISSFLKANYSFAVDKDNIMITSGGQQGLDIISKTLVNPGDVIFVENPTYPGAFSAFKSRGATIFGIPLNSKGLDIDTLKQRLKTHKPRFLYIMPNLQSPTSINYSKKVMNELLELSQEHGFYIIEDDFLTDLSFDKPLLPLKAMDNTDHVVFIKSFSKVIMPGIRLGFMTLPRKLYTSIIKAKHTTDISSSGYLQRAMDYYLRNGNWKEHIKNLRLFYEKRCVSSIKALNELKALGVSFTEPGGGLSIWLKLPDGVSAIELFKECDKRNVAIVPGSVFYVPPAIEDSHIRLSFSQASELEFEKGVRVIKEILSGISSKEDDSFVPFL